MVAFHEAVCDVWHVALAPEVFVVESVSLARVAGAEGRAHVGNSWKRVKQKKTL